MRHLRVQSDVGKAGMMHGILRDKFFIPLNPAHRIEKFVLITLLYTSRASL